MNFESSEKKSIVLNFTFADIAGEKSGSSPSSPFFTLSSPWPYPPPSASRLRLIKDYDYAG